MAMDRFYTMPVDWYDYHAQMDLIKGSVHTYFRGDHGRDEVIKLFQHLDLQYNMYVGAHYEETDGPFLKKVQKTDGEPQLDKERQQIWVTTSVGILYYLLTMFEQADDPSMHANDIMTLIAKVDDSEKTFTKVIEYLKKGSMKYPPVKLSPAKWSK